MVTVSVVPSTEEHIAQIAALVRPEDREELWASAMQTPEQAMECGLRHSDKALTGMVDGRAVCMWGVVHESLIGPVGSPWMVGTILLDEYAKIFLRRCGKVVVDMFEDYGLLMNHVDSRNTRAIQWLKWLGFTVDKPEPFGLLGLPFHKFEKRNKAYV